MFLCLGGQSPPEAYGSRCVCVSVSFREILFAFSPHSLNIKDWNVQCKLNAMLSWNRIGEFWIRDFIVELWHDLLTLTAVASSPAKNKSLTTGCLSTWQFNLYNKSDSNQSEIQRTRLPKLHCVPQHIMDRVQLKVWSWMQLKVWSWMQLKAWLFQSTKHTYHITNLNK